MKDILGIPRTALEVFNMLPEGTRCEVIDNVLYMSPPVTTLHQQVLGHVFCAIKLSLDQGHQGEIYIGPFDIYLDDEQTVLTPDIVFIKPANNHVIKKKGIYGSPDLLVEILSSNKTHDTVLKLEVYQRNQVPEYIIIDPDTKESWHYLLKDGQYQQQLNIQKGQIFIETLKLAISF